MNIRSKNNEIRTYQVEAGSSMFGLTEFLQMLLKRTDNLSVDVSEQVDILLNIDEVISLEEDYEIEVKARFFETNSLEDRRYDFVANVGGANTQ